MLEEVKELLGDVLQMGDRVAGFNAETALLGSLPELDSQAALSVILALEEHFGFVVDDDEFSGEIFETLGSLTQFVEGKSAS